MKVRRRPALAPLRELEDRRLLSVTPVGAEVRVNTYTQGAQQTFQQTPRAVAMNSSTGDYVAVWSSQGQNPGGGWDVYFQRYNAAGVAQGPETLVDTPVSGINQQYASVAMNASGSFVVTWSSNQSGDWNVYAQRYNASGVAQGTAIQVGAVVGADQQYSTVAMDGSGNFIVTWSGHQSGKWNVYANRFDSSGNSLSGPLPVSDVTVNNDQMFSDVAMNAAGSYVVTWSGYQSGHWDVYAQSFAADGTPATPIFQVNTTTSSDQEFSTAAIATNGNFAVTWSGHQSGKWDVYAQTYQANGAAVSSDTQVNTFTNDDQEFSTSAYANSGNLVVTWSSHKQDGNGWGVYAQEITPAGSLLGGEVKVNTYTQGDQTYSSIASNQNRQPKVPAK